MHKFHVYWGQLWQLTRQAVVKVGRYWLIGTTMQNDYYCILIVLQGEWKPKQIDNPEYKGKWIHPEIDNPEYEADDQLYKFDNIGTIGFDLWQVSRIFHEFSFNIN